MTDARYAIRTATVHDIADLLLIEQQCFTWPWSWNDFNLVFERDALALLVKDRTARAPRRGGHLTVAMAILAQRSEYQADILNLAVAPDYQRQGIGRWLLGSAESRILGYREKLHLDAVVIESNLRAQRFFAACGYRALRVIHRKFEETPQDCYYFRRTLRRAQVTA